ncbi:MAG: C40 family peptidase [Deltaproteobacteria bacterium]|nr:C40 family peptidase [Deltaproteobacteria bacterium]
MEALARVATMATLALAATAGSGCQRLLGERGPAQMSAPAAWSSPPGEPWTMPESHRPLPASEWWSPEAMTAVTYARANLGKPYCWGGTGPFCYDCSGLTHAAWQAAGTIIPRTSAAQKRDLRPVPWPEIQPGDIVWRPGHVGLYVGGGWVIHAPQGGKVVEYQPAWKYVGAVRPPAGAGFAASGPERSAVVSARVDPVP